MVCPRCGTLATAKSPACTRCGGSLARPAVDLPEPPIPRAPTHRGEMAQRAAGIEPQVLAKAAPPRTDRVPDVPRYTPPAVSTPTPAGPQVSTWPPPPATWEPVPATATPASSAPPPAWAPPDPNWAPPPTTWAPPAAPPGASRQAWVPPAHRWALPRMSRQAQTTSAPTYFWQALVCLFLFLPTGAAAVFYSLMVTRRSQVGDAAGATRASYLARIWCLWSLVGLAAVLVISTVAGAKL